MTADVGVRVLTPATSGAIAVIQVEAAQDAPLEALLTGAGVRVPPVGGLRVGSIAGVDEGVVARWSATSVHLMPHAGPAVVSEVVRRLVSAGASIRVEPRGDARVLFPEAADTIEAQALEALSRAASPLAVDLLLDQGRRWREAGEGAASDPERDRVLHRLIEPPLVVSVVDSIESMGWSRSTPRSRAFRDATKDRTRTRSR